MHPKKMSGAGASGGCNASSTRDDDDIPPFHAPPPPCGPAQSSPSHTEETQSYNSMLFKAIKVLFVESISVDDFMDCNEISDLLTTPEMERVSRRSAQEGEYQAARLLLDILKRKQGWFDRVLEALAHPRLRQQELRRQLLRAKEKVDRRWQESRRSDIDGGPRVHAMPVPILPTTATTMTTTTTTIITPIQETTPLKASSPPGASAASSTPSQYPPQSPPRHPVRSQSEPGLDRHYYAKVDDPAALGTISWFHGTLSREAAERLLDGRDPGSFLVRRSPARDRYVLTFRNTSRVIHVVIDERADATGRICYSLGEDNTIRYSTVTKLIEYYGANPLRVSGQELPTCLSRPVASRFEPT